ncbi:MAG: hypothetical protein EOO22_21690 [Comamonadaceae bacterium]|nr:MAG: hypothetical protein EOO22_21690 [Comamonadaceae bacterium]
MATAQAQAQAILGAGSVQLNVFDVAAQQYSGWGDPLGADKFELTPDSDVKEKTSKKRESYGQAIASVPLAKPTKLVIVISAADKAAMSLQFQGVLASYSQAAGSIAGTVVAKLDKWVPLSKRQIVEAGFSLTGATTGALTKDVDYVVDYATGEVKFLSSGAVDANGLTDACRGLGSVVALHAGFRLPGRRLQRHPARRHVRRASRQDRAVRCRVRFRRRLSGFRPRRAGAGVTHTPHPLNEKRTRGRSQNQV